MPLAKRIIPTLLHKNGTMVKGKRFVNDRVIGPVLQAAKIHAARGVDELLILDVTATKEGREPNYKLVEQITDGNFSPVTIGGGISKLEHIKNLLAAGADKVLIGEAKEIIPNAAIKFGKQCIVISMDHHYNKATHVHPYIQDNVGEILLQYIDNDGTMQGYDIETIRWISYFYRVPVIASGGCSGYEDMHKAILAGADAVAAGALFQFTDATPKGAAEYLHSKGIEVRL